MGLAFLVRALSDEVQPSSEIVDYKWVNSLEELDQFKCIPGIHNHFVDAQKAIANGNWDSLERMNLTTPKYLNKG